MQNYKYLGTIRDAAILTTSYVAHDVVTPANKGNLQNQLVLYLEWTKGTATSLDVKLEFSHDNDTWFQEDFNTPASGVAAMLFGSYNFTETGNHRLTTSIKDNYIRVSVKGVGTVSDTELAIYAVVGVA